ncbi:rod-binding protein [Jannaschia sp. S6380]|uniref:rod-binding protein n=1 Tax=Jannaschia sp. S6380 TaxID=2926408 RepID=UPI001FF4016E|nr:rod-binding protein [Jannaschia sp. S6380]MCK0168882.1 rod-binding protein [Jannaschia sp. S6380]
MIPTSASINVAAPNATATLSPSRQDALRAQATELEAFLFAEMLRVSGTGSPSPSGGGETQFDSFLRQSQAEAVAASGRTGLAEAIYRSLVRAV